MGRKPSLWWVIFSTAAAAGCGGSPPPNGSPGSGGAGAGNASSSGVGGASSSSSSSGSQETGAATTTSTGTTSSSSGAGTSSSSGSSSAGTSSSSSGTGTGGTGGAETTSSSGSTGSSSAATAASSSTGSSGAGGAGGAETTSSASSSTTSSSSSASSTGSTSTTSSATSTSTTSSSSSASSASSSSSSSSGSGGCTNPCYAGQTSCAGALLSTCVLSNGCYVWDQGTACPSSQSCYDGVCALGAVTITQDTTLCGDLYYSGPFAIQGGATVTCPSGALAIHAPSISIDPSSAIDLSATSGKPGGAAGWYTDTPPYSSIYEAAASGGGYGTPGGDGVVTSCEFVQGNWDIWPGTNPGGPAYGSLYDPFIALGSMGGTGYGSCPVGPPAGGSGGGSIALVATTAVSLLGKVLVNGGSATSISCPGMLTAGGGGSGGGVLVMAPTVHLGPTSIVSAAGGGSWSTQGNCGDNLAGGTGGMGRIKILYGDTYTPQGEITGSASSNSISWMPPVTITSSTQPSPTLFYNDGFTQPLAFSWEEPYPGVLGYYYALSSNPALQLTPSNGTFTLQTSASIPASQATGSPMYFYALTLDGSGTPGTVANQLTVQINGAVDVLSSPSNPSQSAWYSPTNPVLMEWSPPGGVPAASFREVYYRVDQVSDTAPPDFTQPVIGWTSSTAANAVLLTDAQGNALQAGTYYFHLVALDTMGVPTKAVAHYRLQLGTQPATTTFFGYVENQSAAPIKGATLLLQPYGLSTTTDANGYFTLSSVYEMTYTLSATAPGYAPASVPLGLTGTTSPYTLTMSP